MAGANLAPRNPAFLPLPTITTTRGSRDANRRRIETPLIKRRVSKVSEVAKKIAAIRRIGPAVREMNKYSPSTDCHSGAALDRTLHGVNTLWLSCWYRPSALQKRDPGQHEKGGEHHIQESDTHLQELLHAAGWNAAMFPRLRRQGQRQCAQPIEPRFESGSNWVLGSSLFRFSLGSVFVRYRIVDVTGTDESIRFVSDRPNSFSPEGQQATS